MDKPKAIEIRPISHFIESRWPIGNSELIPTTGPILIACDHPPFPGLFPLIHGISKIRPDLVVMSDAIMSLPIEKLMGVRTIPINAVHNVSWAKDITERKKMQKVRRVGETLGLYKVDGSQGVNTVLDKAVDELQKNAALLIAPAGQNSREASWKSGFGNLVKRVAIINNGTFLVFVSIDRTKKCLPTVLQCIRLNQLDLDRLSSMSSHLVSKYFQDYFEALKATIQN